MDQVVTTVCFDGQFWIAFIEKTQEDGTLAVGKHTFGPEPPNPELLAFMLDVYALVPVYPSSVRVRIRAKKSICEQERSTNKAKLAFTESQKAWFAGRKKDGSQQKKVDAARRYEIRIGKKKEKSRGH